MSFAQNLARILGPVPYTPSYADEIKRHRQKFPLGLAIDRLLVHLGLSNAAKAYPPRSRDAFLKLVDEIDASKPDVPRSTSRVYQARALLYLFLDFSQVRPESDSTSGSQTVADYYVSQTWLSYPEQALVRGLWALDHSKPQESVALLGQPWDARGADDLHAFIVEALSMLQPAAVSIYLAARGPQIEFQDQLVKSLVIRGKFAEVLEIARAQKEPEYLKALVRPAIEDKAKALELAQLPTTTEEWQVIQDDLNRIIVTSSPSLGDVNATNTLARDIMLVHALHTGDSDTVLELRDTAEHADRNRVFTEILSAP